MIWIIGSAMNLAGVYTPKCNPASVLVKTPETSDGAVLCSLLNCVRRAILPLSGTEFRGGHRCESRSFQAADRTTICLILLPGAPSYLGYAVITACR